MTVCHLASAGYGSIAEIEAMDTPQFLNLVEMEHIKADVAAHHRRMAERHGNRN